MSNSWDKYFQSTQALKPSKYLVEALKTHSPLGGKALDLGCGAGRDSRYLLEKGFYVTTVDAAQDAAKYISQLPHQEKLQFICSKFEDFDFGYDNYDLINAHYALPFVNPANFEVVFQKVTTSLKSHGLFVGQLFALKTSGTGRDRN